VRKSGTGYRVDGEILKGTAQLYLAVDVGEGTNNEGTVSVSGANTGGKFYGPSSETPPCTFELIEAEEGRAWLSFACDEVRSGNSESEVCSLNNGYVVLENCGT